MNILFWDFEQENAPANYASDPGVFDSATIDGTNTLTTALSAAFSGLKGALWVFSGADLQARLNKAIELPADWYDLRQRAYFNTNSFVLTAGSDHDIMVMDLGGTVFCRMRLRSNGGSPELNVRLLSPTVTSANFAISTSTWYKLEMRFEHFGTFDAVALYVDDELKVFALDVGNRVPAGGTVNANWGVRAGTAPLATHRFKMDHLRVACLPDPATQSASGLLSTGTRSVGAGQLPFSGML